MSGVGAIQPARNPGLEIGESSNRGGLTRSRSLDTHDLSGLRKSRQQTSGLRNRQPLPPARNTLEIPGAVVVAVNDLQLLARAQQELTDALGTLPWHPDVANQPEELARQHALERRYVEQTGAALLRRRQALGEDYRLGDHSMRTHDGLMPASYEFGTGFVSSACRSPVIAAILTALDRDAGELSAVIDKVLLAGFVGGLVIHFVEEFLLAAAAQRAKVGNLAEVKPVPIEALIPDPGAVQLETRDGKRYRELDAAELDELRDKTAERRHAVTMWQAGLAGEGLFPPLLAPTLTALANMIRRAWTSRSGLLTPAVVYFTAALASGLAGGLSRTLFCLQKISGETTVDNLIGGTQKLPLYRVQKPHDRRHARWSDLPVGAWNTLRQAGNLAGQWGRNLGGGTDPAVSELTHLMARVGANMAASIASAFVPLGVVAFMRGNQMKALAGESTWSLPNLLEQADRSWVNDWVHTLAKGGIKTSYPLTASEDRHRRQQEKVWTREASTAWATARGVLAAADVDTVASAPWREALQDVRQQLAPAEPTEDNASTALRRLLDVQTTDIVAAEPGQGPERGLDLANQLWTELLKSRDSLRAEDKSRRWREGT